VTSAWRNCGNLGAMPGLESGCGIFPGVSQQFAVVTRL
jgi:hypothetical protein